MQRLEVSVAVRPIYVSLGVKRLTVILKIRANPQKCPEIRPLLKHPKVSFHFHNIPTPVPILGQINQLPTLPSRRLNLRST